MKANPNHSNLLLARADQLSDTVMAEGKLLSAFDIVDG